jgi:hypothetical protein
VQEVHDEGDVIFGRTDDDKETEGTFELDAIPRVGDSIG